MRRGWIVGSSWVLVAIVGCGDGDPGPVSPHDAAVADQGAGEMPDATLDDDGGSAAGDAGPPPAIDAAPDPPDAGPPPLSAEARYLVTVRTPGWDSSDGTLVRFRRADDGAWVRDADDVAIVLGRNGLGWGRGLHGEGAVEGFDGPRKMEGDRRSPAGAFWLDRVYGYASDPPDGTRAPYEAMTPTLQCIEDVDSAYYNRVVDRALVMPDWDSTDLLRRMDGLYELIVFVRHNSDPAPVPGAGSCILLHVTGVAADGSINPTAGCTSVAFPDLQQIVRALEPDANLLVQLPEDVYDGLVEAWELPPI